MTRKSIIAAVLALSAGPAAAQQITTFPNALLPLSGSESMYIVQSGTSKQITIGNLLKIGGTVTSVGLSMPNPFLVSGSPVTSAGTLTVTLASETANTVFAGPTAGSGVPSFRALVNADLPTTTVTPGTYGDGTHVGQFTVNAQGVLTAASAVTITGAAPTGSAGGDLSGTYPSPSVRSINGASLGSTTATAGNLLIGGGGSWITRAMSGDCTIGLLGGITCTKTSGVAFAPSATTDTTNATNITTGTLSNALLVSIPNSSLANPATTVNGQTCTLGSTCTVTAAATAIAVGTTTVTGGTNNYVLTTGTGTLANTPIGTSGAAIPLLNGTNVWSAQQSASVTSLTISTATFTPTGASNNYAITLVHASCPCTLANPSATPVAGTSGQITVTQSATGSDLISTWGSDYEAPGGTSSITLSTGANAVDILSYYVIDSTHIALLPSLNFTH